MALPRRFVSEKLSVCHDDFRDLFGQVVPAGVFTRAQRAFNPQQVPFLDVLADRFRNPTVGNYSVPFGLLVSGAVGAVDRFRCGQRKARCRRAATRLHQLRCVAYVAEEDGFVDGWHVVFCCLSFQNGCFGCLTIVYFVVINNNKNKQNTTSEGIFSCFVDGSQKKAPLLAGQFWL